MAAAIAKEALDSDRVNYLIWRYVFLVIHRRLGFPGTGLAFVR
jgi:hypothetical protein